MAKQKYDQQLKNDVIEEILIGERSAAQVARDRNLSTSAVYSWIKIHKDKTGSARLTLLNETPEQEIKRLKIELKRVKEEREILKKATAYFASLKK